MTTPAPYAILRAHSDALQADLRTASADIRAIPGCGTGPMGLTPDDVKASPAYREARARYDRLHKALGRVNAVIMRHYRSQARDDALAARHARAAA